MSRTREIEGWVYSSQADHKRIEFSTTQEVMSGVNERIKAKLIIELPSPKITISEEEFDNAFSESALETKTLYSSHLFRELKSKLFKDAE